MPTRPEKIYRLSRIERRNPLLAIVGWIARLPLRPLALLKHRGVLHWPTVGAMITAALAVAAAVLLPAAVIPVIVGFGASYVTHSLADALTPHGCQLLAPWDRRKVHLLPRRYQIRTGSIQDVMVGACAMMVALATLTGSL